MNTRVGKASFEIVPPTLTNWRKIQQLDLVVTQYIKVSC